MALSEKSVNTIQNLINSLGERKTAVKLVDHFLTRISGISSSELGDTSIFADGLDEIEYLLKDGDFESAFMTAKDTATNMLEDEGFGMGMDESRKKVIKLTESQLRKIIKIKIQEQRDIDELDYDRLQTGDDLQGLRDAIKKNKTVSVAFVKKDGSVRHMAVRRTLSSYVGSTSEKTDAQKNVEENNDIKRVIDINAYIKMLKETGDKELSSKNAWRSINLKNVLGFMVSGKFIDLREENQIRERFGDDVYNSLTKSMVKSMESVQQELQQEEPNNNIDNIESVEESKIIKITESQFDRLLKNIGKEAIRNKRMVN